MRPLEELEDLARQLVGDQGAPNVFFVTDKRGTVVAVILEEEAALRFAQRNGSAAVEDRSTGVVWEGGPIPNSGEVDTHAADELLLYLQNDSRFWGPRSQGEAIERRYATLWRKGQFDRERAIDGYMHVLKTAAQQYVKELGSPGDRWYTMFNVPTRRAAGGELADQFIAEAELGNFRSNRGR